MIRKLPLLIFTLATLYSSGIADTKAVKFLNAHGTTSKDVLTKLIANEKQSADIRPHETNNLKTIAVINKKQGLSLKEAIFYSSKTNDFHSTNGILLGKNGEINFKLSEDNNVIANTEKATN